MLQNPLRATAALLALLAGTALLPNLSSLAHAQEPAPFDPSEAGEYCGQCGNNKHLHGCSHGHCKGGHHLGGHHLGGHHLGGHHRGGNHLGAPIDSRDLFYNYYVGPADAPGPTGANSVAAMYPSPLPTPLHVGHTYITYQPLLPHEFLYPHRHNYYSSTPGGGQVTTRVHYRTSILGHWNPAFGNRAPRPRGVNYLQDPLKR